MDQTKNHLKVDSKTVQAAFKTNSHSFRCHGIRFGPVLITIENLNKTVLIWCFPIDSIIDILWSNSEGLLPFVLKDDWDSGKIPRIFDQKYINQKKAQNGVGVKVFISSDEVLKDTWVLVYDTDQPLVAQNNKMPRIGIDHFCQYSNQYLTTQIKYDNDRCPDGAKCVDFHNSTSRNQTNSDQTRRKTDNCTFVGNFDRADHSNAAHSDGEEIAKAVYHIKIKWSD